MESVDGAELNDAPEAANQLEVAARQAGMVMFGNAAREGFFSDFKRVSQTHHDVLIDGVSPPPHTCFTHCANASARSPSLRLLQTNEALTSGAQINQRFFGVAEGMQPNALRASFGMSTRLLTVIERRLWLPGNLEAQLLSMDSMTEEEQDAAADKAERAKTIMADGARKVFLKECMNANLLPEPVRVVMHTACAMP